MKHVESGNSLHERMSELCVLTTRHLVKPKFDSLRQFSGIALSGSPAKSAEKALFRLSALKIIVQNIFLPIADSRIFCA